MSGKAPENERQADCHDQRTFQAKNKPRSLKISPLVEQSGIVYAWPAQPTSIAISHLVIGLGSCTLNLYSYALFCPSIQPGAVCKIVYAHKARDV